jgi:hypothetical protein
MRQERAETEQPDRRLCPYLALDLLGEIQCEWTSKDRETRCHLRT